MALALHGIRVLDLSLYGPGEYCSMTLGDMGADVIRIEEAGGPKGRRLKQAEGVIGSAGASRAVDKSSPYYAFNRNKRSLALNLKAPEGQEIFRRLSARSDVILEGFRPGVAKRLGIDYDTIRRVNERIVYCSLSGYGQDGPYRDLVGHDINYISMAGALGITGVPGGPPVIPGFQLADFAGGSLRSIIGILLALLARERTGRGQFVDTAMADGVLSLLLPQLSTFLASGHVPKMGETRLSGGMPAYNVYETRDGKYITVGCTEPWLYANLCRAIGREDLIPFQNPRGEKREEVLAIFRQIFRGRTREEWFELLRRADVCVGKVYSLDEVEADPHVRHRQMIVELDHPTLGKVKQMGVAIKLSDTPGSIRTFPPAKGEHTEAILADLGYSPERIRELAANGVVDTYNP